MAPLDLLIAAHALGAGAIIVTLGGPLGHHCVVSSAYATL